MTYIIYFLFSLVLCVIYILKIKRLEKKLRNLLEQERQNYLNKMIDDYPNIKEYLGQIGDDING